MKEINILCVEDGSVDVERLEEEGLHDGKVLIYRQGANPPFVLKLKTDDEQLKSEQNKVAVDKLEELRSWALQYGQTIYDKIDLMIKEIKGDK